MIAKSNLKFWRNAKIKNHDWKYL